MFIDVNILLFVYSILTVSGLVPSPDIRQIMPDLRICHRNEANLNRCMQQSLETLRPYLKSGIPELEVPSCEPLHLSQLKLKSSDRIDINSTFKEMLIRGTTNFVVKSVDINPDLSLARLKFYVPHLQVEGHYDMDGKVLSMPMIGNGFAQCNCTCIDAMIIVKGEQYESKSTGHTHFRVNDLELDFDIGHVSVEMDNLHSDHKLLTNAMNLFLNNNWRSIMDEMKPTLEDAVADIFKSIANKIYSSFPLDSWILP